MKNNLTGLVQLRLYGRRECHLCEDMQEGLKPLSSKLGFTVEVIDIDADPDLINEYGSKVPVLMHERHEICHYFLDPQALQMYFSPPPE